MNALKNAYYIFHIVQPGHKRQATASNWRSLLMQATGDSQPRQRLDPAGPWLQSGGFDTAPSALGDYEVVYSVWWLWFNSVE